MAYTASLRFHFEDYESSESSSCDETSPLRSSLSRNSRKYNDCKNYLEYCSDTCESDSDCDSFQDSLQKSRRPETSYLFTRSTSMPRPCHNRMSRLSASQRNINHRRVLLKRIEETWFDSSSDSSDCSDDNESYGSLSCHSSEHHSIAQNRKWQSTDNLDSSGYYDESGSCVSEGSSLKQSRSSIENLLYDSENSHIYKSQQDSKIKTVSVTIDGEIQHLDTIQCFDYNKSYANSKPKTNGELDNSNREDDARYRDSGICMENGDVLKNNKEGQVETCFPYQPRFGFGKNRWYKPSMCQ
ncbi:hypothetical protein SNE40_016543 [Patella caerulea]|uniref:Uncharacterized protein n=1 Tax=Patella caerulea TaxID=87958 RepID=A0AAN8JDG6_PATCE